jgi:hypothetical protein
MKKDFNTEDTESTETAEKRTSMQKRSDPTGAGSSGQLFSSDSREVLRRDVPQDSLSSSDVKRGPSTRCARSGYASSSDA